MGSAGEFSVAIAETPQEREAVFRLRYQVYVEEMGKRLASADHGRRLLTDPLDETGLLFLARDPEGEVAATLRCNEGLEGIPR